jgi:hypothetical protein
MRLGEIRNTKLWRSYPTLRKTPSLTPYLRLSFYGVSSKYELLLEGLFHQALLAWVRQAFHVCQTDRPRGK